MRSLFLLTLPTLLLAAPPAAPSITAFTFAGSGCNNDSGSVKADSTVIGDSEGFSFSQFSGDSTDNCGIHINSAGASEGWQVALSQVTYEGRVSLTAGSYIQTYTTVFWSENASNTAQLKATLAPSGSYGDYVTIKSNTTDYKWSKCTGADGNPGILNINLRPVIQGDGSYNIKHATAQFVWQRC